jgi:phosphoserine phosphatase
MQAQHCRKWLELAGFTLQASEPLACRIAAGPGLAVFDADHTLWNTDVGEGFYHWLVTGRRLKSVDCDADLFAHYRREESRDKLAAYALLVEQMEGLLESDVMEWARAYVGHHVPGAVYPAQRALLRLLEHQGWETWIVSASNRWSVSAGARYLGMAPERVIGVDLVARGGALTSRLAYPLTYGPGKVEAILSRIGRRPDLVVGDSVGDREMMELSQALALLVEYPEDSHQEPIRAVARDRSWLRQSWTRSPSRYQADRFAPAS